MVDYIGIVIRKDSNRYAQVVTDRKGSCGGCQSTTHACLSCQASAKIESRVSNPLGAEPGDLVKVRLSTSGLLAGAAILYLLPVLGLLLGASTGVGVARGHGLSEMSASIGGAAAGLCIGYLAAIGLERSPRIRRRIMPTITAILAPKVGLPEAEKASCCGQHGCPHKNKAGETDISSCDVCFI
jgi:sigma-E factor negative regulatory protein RseC